MREKERTKEPVKVVAKELELALGLGQKKAPVRELV